MLLILAVLTMTGCQYNGTPEQKQRDTDIESARYMTEFNYKGHRYLRYKVGFGETRAVGITHDPDCPCREKGGEE